MSTYNQAYEAARQLSDLLGRPCGIDKLSDPFGPGWNYNCICIPKDPAKRYGLELRCEVVEPGSPRMEGGAG